MKNDVVIIGSGHASGIFVHFLRKINFIGSITIIGNEEYLPYERPELSKKYLDYRINEEKLFIKSEEYYKKQKINLIRNTKVTKIDKSKKQILLENTIIIDYEFLVIASGASLRKIPTDSNIDINYLKTIDDAKKLKAVLNNKESIGIIGGGYIGLEVASISRNIGLETIVIEAKNILMKRVTTPIISQYFAKKHREKGVQCKLKTNVEEITEHNSKKIITCSDGSENKVDIILAAIGVVPNTTLALDAGLNCSAGILVDSNCLTSDDNILAIGDCTNHYNIRYGKQINLQSVHNAVEQAKTAAFYIAGMPKPYNQVPWFWSNQYDLKLQIIGLNEDYDELVTIGSKKENSFSVISLKQQEIIAVESVNAPSDFVFGKKLIEKRIKINISQNDNKSLNLRELYRSSLL